MAILMVDGFDNVEMPDDWGKQLPKRTIFQDNILARSLALASHQAEEEESDTRAAANLICSGGAFSIYPVKGDPSLWVVKVYPQDGLRPRFDDVYLLDPDEETIDENQDFLGGTY